VPLYTAIALLAAGKHALARTHTHIHIQTHTHTHTHHMSKVDECTIFLHVSVAISLL
jgi:hypothetical protein